MQLIKHKSKSAVDMTDGSITKHILYFAFPLFLGYIFQMLYNTVDTWVVGNYVSDEAFAAVGSVGSIINLLVGFFSGLSSGSGVIISQFYGAGNPEKVREAVKASAYLTVVSAIFLTAIGIILTPLFLNIMNTPEEVIDDATIYLSIIFSGLSGLMVYNLGSGILRAVGDSTRPFYFLVISAVINTVLDLVFVLVFGLGVAGVALATIIAQFISAILVIITLVKDDSPVKLCGKDVLDAIRHPRSVLPMLGSIIKVGIPAALQLSITSFSNIFVQSYINFFGKGYMSGWTVYTKVDQFLMLPSNALALATTTFVGQNLGGGQVKRAKRGVKTSLGISLGAAFLILIPIIVFAEPITLFFIDEPDAVGYGTLFLRVISPFYLCAITQGILTSALRGAGNSRTPMIVVLASLVGFRQVYLFVMANFISNTPIPIAMSYPAGWIVASVAMIICYLSCNLERYVVTKSKS